MIERCLAINSQLNRVIGVLYSTDWKTFNGIDFLGNLVNLVYYICEEASIPQVMLEVNLIFGRKFWEK